MSGFRASLFIVAFFRLSIFASAMVLHFSGPGPPKRSLGPLVPRAASPPKCNTITGTEQDQVEIEGNTSAFGNNGVIRRLIKFIGEKGAFGNEKTYIGNEKLDYVRN